MEQSENQAPVCYPKQIENFERVKRCFRILLAEDIEENILLAKIRLMQHGHTVIEARNGFEAVDAFQRENPDIILMDVHMPEMDGIEATYRIRSVESAGRRVPIIALTASVTNKEHQKYLQAEMDDVVAKPIDFETLFSTIEKLVPEDRGQKMQNAQCRMQNKQNTDEPSAFERIEGVDVKKGIHIWQNEAAYKKALLGFSRDYQTAAKKIRQLLENGDRDGAYRIAHAMKGVSGNLSLTEIYPIAEKLNDLTRLADISELNELIKSLEAALKVVVPAIQRLETEDAQQGTEHNIIKESPDIPALKKLFIQLLTSFKDFNPDVAEPVMNLLKERISLRQIKPIQQELDRFNFKNAEKETLKLAQTLGIEIDIRVR